MAKMYPEYPIDELHFKHDSEKLVFRLLRDKLPDDFIVIFSRSWVSNEVEDRKNGEADFVIIHPTMGVLVLEAKAGRIEYSAAKGWTSTNGDGITYRINPFEQVLGTEKYLLNRWKKQYQGFLPITSAVCFTSMDNIPPVLPMDAHRDIIITRAHFFSNTLKEKIETALRFANHPPAKPSTLEHIRSFFVHSCNFTTNLRTDIDTGKEQIFRMTAEQFQILENLDQMDQVAILGGAGTGKTMIAVEKAIRMTKEGKSVLFVCYNEQLARHLRRKYKDFNQIKFYHFHHLCQKACELVKDKDDGQLVKDYFRMKQEMGEARFSHEAFNFLLDAAQLMDTKDLFDAIVMDEGQDFAQDWVDSLFFLTKEGNKSPFYVFYDKSQNLYNRDFDPTKKMFTFRLTKNMRNTRQIHDYSTKFEPMSGSNIHSGFSGRDVEIKVLKHGEDPQSALKIILRDILKHVEPKDVAILSGIKVPAAKLAEMPELPLTKLYEERDHKVTVNTIHSFKGMESPVVVINNLNDLRKNRDEKLLYVATTRAQLHLVIICSEEVSARFELSDTTIKKAS